MKEKIPVDKRLLQDTIIFLHYIISSAEEEIIKDTAQKFLNSYNLIGCDQND